MTDITERVVVHCPNHEAACRLAAFVDEYSVRNGAVQIPLRLPTKLFAEERGLLERRVVATLYPLRSISDPHPTYSVTWVPQAIGPCPAFAGALAVERSSQHDRFGLIMSGHYEPPFDDADAPFDAALVQRIARASARDLLRSIANYVEHACAHDEAARAGYARGALAAPTFAGRN